MRVWNVLGVVCVLGLAGCASAGGSADSPSLSPSAPAPGTETAADAAVTATPAGSPITVVGLWEIAGESAYAVDAYENAAQLAVATINAEGGIDGRPIEYSRVPMDPGDGQKAIGQFLEAMDRDPVAVVGFPSSNTLLAAQSTIERSGIPVLATTSASDNVAYGSPGVSELTWIINTRTSQTAFAAVDYAVEELGAEKVALLGTDESYGRAATEAAAQQLEAHGLAPSSSRLYATDATDLTAQVIEAGDADVLLHFGYPNQHGIQMNQFLENGIGVPTIAGASALLADEGGLIRPEAIEGMRVSTACNPSASGITAELAALRDDYEAEYGGPPTIQATQAYDAFFILKAAIESAGSTDPAAVNAAMGEITVPGRCAAEYRADGAHFMSHQVTITEYGADGTARLAETIEMPDVPKFS